jgi:magnesium-transporting ATPase (P-type)
MSSEDRGKPELIIGIIGVVIVSSYVILCLVSLQSPPPFEMQWIVPTFYFNGIWSILIFIAGIGVAALYCSKYRWYRDYSQVRRQVNPETYRPRLRAPGQR